MSQRKLQIKNRFITAVCLAGLISGVVAYMYFLSISVVHVVMRKEVIQETVQLRSEIAFLETEYIEANHIISNRVATLDGFKEVQAKIFISSAGVSKNLVLRTAGE